MHISYYCVWGVYPHGVVLKFHFLCFKILKHIERTWFLNFFHGLELGSYCLNASILFCACFMCVTLLMCIMFNTNLVTHNKFCATNFGLMTNAKEKKK